jgi:hypothetical protein
MPVQENIVTQLFEYVCSDCGTVSTVASVWSLKRKTYPNLCKTCTNRTKTKAVGSGSKFAKDWNHVYADPLQTAEDLTSARQLKLKYYKNVCSVHGPMPYATLDQTCRICTREQAKNRNRTNASFNRPRIILSSIKRRAAQKQISCELTLEHMRSIIPDTCPVLGNPLSYDTDRETSPSVDRFDSSKGYTVDNVVIISDRANRIKNDGTAEEHIKVALWMLTRQGKTEEEILNLLTSFVYQKNIEA